MKIEVLCDNCKKSFMADEQDIEKFELYCRDCLDIMDFNPSGI